MVQQRNMTSRFSTSELPKHVKIVEVGPRDGLQNEKVQQLCKMFIFISNLWYYFRLWFLISPVSFNRKLSQQILRLH